MNYLVKLLEQANLGWTVRDQFHLTGDDYPTILDVPVALKDPTAPLRRYKFRVKTDEALYYVPLEET